MRWKTFFFGFDRNITFEQNPFVSGKQERTIRKLWGYSSVKTKASGFSPITNARKIHSFLSFFLEFQFCFVECKTKKFLTLRSQNVSKQKQKQKNNTTFFFFRSKSVPQTVSHFWLCQHCVSSQKERLEQTKQLANRWLETQPVVLTDLEQLVASCESCFLSFTLFF